MGLKVLVLDLGSMEEGRLGHQILLSVASCGWPGIREAHVECIIITKMICDLWHCSPSVGLYQTGQPSLTSDCHQIMVFPSSDHSPQLTVSNPKAQPFWRCSDSVIWPYKSYSGLYPWPFLLHSTHWLLVPKVGLSNISQTLLCTIFYKLDILCPLGVVNVLAPRCICIYTAYTFALSCMYIYIYCNSARWNATDLPCFAINSSTSLYVTFGTMQQFASIWRQYRYTTKNDS